MHLLKYIMFQMYPPPDPTVSPVLEVNYPVRSGASIVPLQCLVTGLLPAQVTVYWVIDGKKVMGHTHSRWTHTINQVLLLAKEWKRQPACVCVVEYGKDTFSKTLQHCGRVFITVTIITVFYGLTLYLSEHNAPVWKK